MAKNRFEIFDLTFGLILSKKGERASFFSTKKFITINYRKKKRLIYHVKNYSILNQMAQKKNKKLSQLKKNVFFLFAVFEFYSNFVRLKQENMLLIEGKP